MVTPPVDGVAQSLYVTHQVFAYFSLLVEILPFSSDLTDFDFGCFSLLAFDGLWTR
jgi:hypothetical protein